MFQYTLVYLINKTFINKAYYAIVTSVTKIVTHVTIMIKTLNKIGETSDKIIASIPFPVYIILVVVCVGVVGQLTYDYINQEPYNNLSQQIIIDLDYQGEEDIKVCDSYSIQTPKIDSICYDADLFYSTGKLEVKK